MKLPKKLSCDLAEEIGWHIGDGSMNIYHNRGKKRGFYQLRGHIEDDKLHYFQRIRQIFKKLYGLNINLREMPSTRVFGFQIWNDELVNYKCKLGLPLGKKDTIIIPAEFLKENKLIISVIRGIFDTDGGIYLERKNNKIYPRIYINTISEPLSKQLFDSLNNLKIRTTRYSQFYERGLKRKRLYIITIRGVEMFNLFMRVISPKNPKHIEKYNKFRQLQNLIK